MSPEPRRVSGPRIPLSLYIHTSPSDPRLFDVVDDEGNPVASNIADLNTARLLAAAPRLLDGFYEMRWQLNLWTEHGFSGREVHELEDWWQGHQDWLDDMGEIEAAACAPDGRFPLEV
jgi:hypothetical protein